jgi:hypothetical protein
MAIRKLERSDWGWFCLRVSRVFLTSQIIDAEGVQQIITLREPLRLPVPHALLT